MSWSRQPRRVPRDMDWVWHISHLSATNTNAWLERIIRHTWQESHKRITVYVRGHAEDYDKGAFSGEGHFCCSVSDADVPRDLLDRGTVIWDRKNRRKETYEKGFIKTGKAIRMRQCVRALFKACSEKGCVIAVLGISFLLFCGLILVYLFAFDRLGFLF